MKKITSCCLLGFLITALSPSAATAWMTSNRFGGSTTHTWGETSHTNMYGGSTQHAYGEGTQHTNMYGGSTSHGWYGGTTHTNVYGGSTSGAYGAGVYHTYPSGASYYRPPYPAYHPAYPVYPYHPPVAVPYYSAAGCYGCAAAAGAVVGMATGAAVASASTAAAASSAYSSGYAAGSATTAATMSGAAPVVVTSLPDDLCDRRELRDAAFRLCDTGCRRQDLLPVWQYLVSAVIRRERHLLPRSADSVRQRKVLEWRVTSGKRIFRPLDTRPSTLWINLAQRRKAWSASRASALTENSSLNLCTFVRPFDRLRADIL